MRARARWMALAGAAGLAIGIAAGFATRELASTAEAPGAGGRGATGAGPDAGLEGLRAELAAQRTLTSALQAELGLLRERVEDLEPFPLTTAADAGDPEDESDGPPDLAEGEDRHAGAWFDPGRLIEVDMDPDDIARIRRHFDAHQLEILFLRDQATREGWMHQPRFANEMRSLTLGLREEIGDADYDALLFATGHPNRVELSALLGGSPAVEAGLEDGDIVLRYDDQEIFHAQGLVRATRSGEAGSTVAMDVLRGDRELRVYVPRGPLGAKLQPARTPPRPE